MTTVISESERVASESSRSVACRHCGQAVPAGLLPAPGSQADAFCCHGCEAAYALLAGAGLDDFYRHREIEGAVAGRRAETSETYEEFDDPSFEARHVQQLGPRTRRV